MGCRRLQLTNRTSILKPSTFSFDLSVMDIYPSLVTGGTLWAIDKDMIARPKDLFASLEQSDIQVWTSTPSFAEMCLMEASFLRVCYQT